MSTAYGPSAGSGGHWRAICDYSATEGAGSVTVRAQAGIQATGWGFSISSGITLTATVDGQSSSSQSGLSSPTSGWGASRGASATKTLAKRHAGYSVAVSAKATNSSGYLNGTSTASASVYIPPVKHSTYHFDANGGTGAPGDADKWYGEHYWMTSARPVRAGYEFLGWSDAKGATSAKWVAGDDVTPDVDTTFYAVWRLAYVPPKVSVTAATRVAASGSTEPSPSCEWAYAAFSWSVDTAVTSGNAVKSAVVMYRRAGSVDWTSVVQDASGTSGACSASFAAAGGSAWEVRCDVTDASGNASATATALATIGTAVVPISFGGKGSGVGVLTEAPDSGFRLGTSDAMASSPVGWRGMAPVTLLDSASGVATQATLAEAVDGFRRLDVWAAKVEGSYWNDAFSSAAHARSSSPRFKGCLVTQQLAGDGKTQQQLTCTWSARGTTIGLGQAMYLNYSASNVQTYGRDDNGKWRIFRVDGWR